MGFMRGRMDVKGACGCAWSHIEPGVGPDDEEATIERVRGEVIAHHQRSGHHSTIVIVREEFFTPDAIPYPGDGKMAEYEAQLANP